MEKMFFIYSSCLYTSGEYSNIHSRTFIYYLAKLQASKIPINRISSIRNSLSILLIVTVMHAKNSMDREKKFLTHEISNHIINSIECQSGGKRCAYIYEERQSTTNTSAHKLYELPWQSQRNVWH